MINPHDYSRFCFRKRFKNEVKWSGGRSTPAGNRGKAETPQRMRGGSASSPAHRASVAQWNDLVFTLNYI